MKLGTKTSFSIKWTYYAICGAMFLWQSTEISINFFQFQTVSTINFVPPGKQYLSPITICFYLDQVLNETKFQSIYRDKNLSVFCLGSDIMSCKFMVIEIFFTTQERFDISLNSSDVVGYYMSYRTPYILGRYICYQMLNPRYLKKQVKEWIGDITDDTQDDIAKYNNIGYVSLDNVTMFRIAIAPIDVLPHFEFFTTEQIEYVGKNHMNLDVSSYFYRFSKLEPPYIDNCIDYKVFGYLNRQDAISTCINNMSIKKRNKTSRTKIFETGNDYQMSISMLIDISDRSIEKCQKNYPNDDCSNELTYTDYEIKNETKIGSKRIFIKQILSTKPSYIVDNQEKIDNVDYITYIFGAAGTWFGFCFLTIEPVNIIEWVISEIKHREEDDCIQYVTKENLDEKFIILSQHIENIKLSIDDDRRKCNHKFEMMLKKINGGEKI